MDFISILVDESMKPNSMEIQEKYDRKYRAGYMESWPSWKRRRIRTLLRGLPLGNTDGNILDFGCGRGEFTSVLKDAYPSCHVEGVDVSLEAVNVARVRAPDCDFKLWNPGIKGKRYDLVFSHHVLEHVVNIDDTIASIAGVCKPGGLMLHILPAGGRGSLEHLICTFRSDGFDPARGNRMFFEHPDHQRRLTAEELIVKFSAHGVLLKRLRYANKFFGSMEWISASGVALIMSVSETSNVDGLFRRTFLFCFRVIAMCLFVLRFPARKLGFYKRRWARRKLYKGMFLGCLVLLPVSIIPDLFVKALSSLEYYFLGSKVGSEMYLMFEKCE